MTFPTNRGIIYKACFYLLDNLPVNILADINMLKAFGYKFEDEVPPVFRHPAEPDPNFNLKDIEELTKINYPTKNMINKYTNKERQVQILQRSLTRRQNQNSQNKTKFQTLFMEYEQSKINYQILHDNIYQASHYKPQITSISHEGEQIYHFTDDLRILKTEQNEQPQDFTTNEILTININQQQFESDAHYVNIYQSTHELQNSQQACTVIPNNGQLEQILKTNQVNIVQTAEQINLFNKLAREQVKLREHTEHKLKAEFDNEWKNKLLAELKLLPKKN